MPTRLSTSELTLALAEALFGDVPDVTDALEADEELSCSFRLLP
jgi:hypothetical protein